MTGLSRRSFLAACALGAATLRGRGARATTVVPITVEALTRRSELVVLATVRATRCLWRSGFIVTDGDLRVEAVMKGDARVGDSLGVRVAGGELDGVGQMIPDAPTLRVGDAAVFFLQGDEQGRHLLAHMTAAVLPVRLGADGTVTVGTAPGLQRASDAAPAGPTALTTFARTVNGATSP